MHTETMRIIKLLIIKVSDSKKSPCKGKPVLN